MAEHWFGYMNSSLEDVLGFQTGIYIRLDCDCLTVMYQDTCAHYSLIHIIRMLIILEFRRVKYLCWKLQRSNWSDTLHIY